MTNTIVNPPALGAPQGFNHGILAPAGGRLLFVAGQNAADANGVVASSDFTAQFETAMERILAVVREAGGEPDHIARLTIYVTDLAAYRAARRSLGEVWRRLMGRQYPAVALLEVKGLVDEGTIVEIEATAVIPEASVS